MIARIPTPAAPAAPYLAFLDALRSAGFRGEIARDHASRTVLATDNSIYQRLPQSAVFPLDAEDVQVLARVAAEPAHRSVRLTPRGGGTGTNGQSLTDGVVVEVVHGGDAGAPGGPDAAYVDGGGVRGVYVGQGYQFEASGLLIRDLEEGEARGETYPYADDEYWWPGAAGLSLWNPLGAKLEHLTVHDLEAEYRAVAISFEADYPKGQADDLIRVTNSIFSDIDVRDEQGETLAIYSQQPGWLEANHSLFVGCVVQEDFVSEGPGNLYSEELPYLAPDIVYAPLHIRPGAPSIDAGDPDAPFENEPEPNGGRVNMGFYGNTAEASVNPGASKTVAEAPCADLPWVSFLGEPYDGSPCGCMNLLSDAPALETPCQGAGVCGQDADSGEPVLGAVECGRDIQSEQVCLFQGRGRQW